MLFYIVIRDIFRALFACFKAGTEVIVAVGEWFLDRNNE